MTIPGSANPLLLASTASAQYTISRSLRFNSSDSAYCSRVFSNASASTWTFSAWVKRSALGAAQKIFGDATDGSTGDSGLWFGSDDTLYLSDGQVAPYKTAAVYRDCSAWYHIVASVSSGTTLKIYVNGVDQTASGTPNITRVNSNRTHAIGYNKPSATNYFSGYLADIHFIDGQALTPSSFTEVSATTGQLIPKKYTGTFGTNGFWLQFADNSSNTATTLGKDTSGNGNNWTPNNLSVTAGAGNDSLVDTPTSYGTDAGNGGEVRGNYCTWNPLSLLASATTSNGNLDASTPTANGGGVFGTIAFPASGKWYFEVTPTTGNSAMIGISDYLSTSSNAWAISPSVFYWNNGKKYVNGSDGGAYGATYAANDVIGVAVNCDSGSITFYKNNSSQGSISCSPGGLYPCLTDGTGGTGDSFSANFGQRPFAYTAPSGFRPLVDTCLPAPAVAKSASAFDVKLYTGNGSTQTISGLGFSPDLVWIKNRSTAATGHVLQDQIRGATAYLFSSATAAENSNTANDWFRAFTTDGFTVAATTTGGTPTSEWNANSATYVAWAWDAGTTTVTNTQGSITSSVRANASAGFSIVTYNSGGSGSTLDTVGHGLGVSPSMVIAKNRDVADSWYVIRSDFSNVASDYLQLNSTAAKTASGSTLWSLSSTTVGVRQGAIASASGQKIVLYCFAPVTGYSSFGSYVGNGSADGVFVYTGFRPRWVMVKNTTLGTASDYWVLFDAARNGYNATEQILYPNFSNAEDTATGNGIDFLSNGFKWRATHTSRNASGSTYIYAAFAESPFQYARAR